MSTGFDLTSEAITPAYRKNVNLEVDPWLHYFIVCSASVNLTLAALAFAF